MLLRCAFRQRAHFPHGGCAVTVAFSVNVRLAVVPIRGDVDDRGGGGGGGMLERRPVGFRSRKISSKSVMAAATSGVATGVFNRLGSCASKGPPFRRGVDHGDKKSCGGSGSGRGVAEGLGSTAAGDQNGGTASGMGLATGGNCGVAVDGLRAGISCAMPRGSGDAMYVGA